MKLYLNPPSPYARKVVVFAHEIGLADRLEIAAFDPWGDPAELLAATPLGKVPALVTDDGDLIVESTTICEYLALQASAPGPDGPGRMQVQARTAIAQGLIDAAFASVVERRRPPERQWQPWIDRQHRAIGRTLPRLAVPPRDRFDLGDVSLACALAYLDFRLADLGWRAGRPDLAAWLDEAARRPSMRASQP